MILRKEYIKHEYLINTYGSFAAARNDKNHVDERRYAGILRLTAGGTLVMGIWSLIKAFMQMLGEIGDDLHSGELPYFISLFSAVFVFAVFFVIAISFRFIIWKSASKEAEDGKKRNGYIVCALALMAYGIYSVAYFIQKVISKDVDGYDITKLIFDMTSFVILCELLHCVFRLRKVRDEIAKEL